MQQMSRNVLTAINTNQEVLARAASQKDCLEHTTNPSLSGRQKNHLPAIVTTQGTSIYVKTIFGLTSKYKYLSQSLAK